MLKTVFENKANDFKWVDVLAPTKEDYASLSETYNLHPAAVKDCMSPFHLPKVEQIENTTFILTRVYDHDEDTHSDTIQQLTNKIAVFITEKAVITLHRHDEPFLQDLRRHCSAQDGGASEKLSKTYFLNHLLDGIVKTFDTALRKATENLDKNEQDIFTRSKDPNIIMNLYHIKRRASVYKRMLFLTKDIINKYTRITQEDDPFSHDLLETADQFYFMANDLDENVNNLLNLHISLASHQTNEVMGVLTIISVFFLPMTFIVGLYGMNFDVMPELHFEYGYLSVWILMILSALGIYVWFKKRGWI